MPGANSQSFPVSANVAMADLYKNEQIRLFLCKFDFLSCTKHVAWVTRPVLTQAIMMVLMFRNLLFIIIIIIIKTLFKEG